MVAKGTHFNLTRFGLAGLGDEGQSFEVKPVSPEGGAIGGSPCGQIDGSWLKCRPVGKSNVDDFAPEAEKGSRAFRVV